MQITIHNFTLTTATTATIMVTATDDSFKKYPVKMFHNMGEIEAEDLTGRRYVATAAIPMDDLNVKVFLNKA